MIKLIIEKKKMQGNLHLFKKYLNIYYLVFYQIDFFINKYSSAIFTNDNFFTACNIELPLRWNFVETSSTGITLDSNYCQSVSCILSDTFECG
jgi:hypothetical protein